MEPIEAFLDEESWASLSKMFSTDQDSFLNHTNDIFSVEIPQDFVFNEENVAAFYDENSMCSSNKLISSTNPDSASQQSGNLVFCPNESNGDNLVHVINREFEPSKVIFPVFGDDLMEEILMCVKEERGPNQLACNEQSQPSANDDCMQLMSKSNTPETQTGAQEDNSFQNPKKRPRRTSNDAMRNKSNEESKTKKNKKAIHKRNDEEETSNARQLGNGQSSTSCSVEDCSNVPQESNEENSVSQSQGLATANSNRKTRAGRGSATDPQSLYARRRREKINERLRILQNLVPNGTKVDISTMLEEAVHYVKFLRLQIKLLSSDDLWMYAPIAFNGMDIDLHHKLAHL